MDAVTDNEDIYVLPTELAKLVVRSVYHNFWDDAGYTQSSIHTDLINSGIPITDKAIHAFRNKAKCGRKCSRLRANCFT